MTNEELTKIRGMTRAEIFSKYTPLRVAGKITQKQYDWLYDQACDSPPKRKVGHHASFASGPSETSNDRGGDEGADTDDHGDSTVSIIIEQFGGTEIGSVDESDRTPHPTQRSGVSQKQRLLAFLQDKAWHSTVEILRGVYGLEEERGIARIGARVYDLKKDGYQVESRKQKGSVWEYRLINETVLS